MLFLQTMFFTALAFALGCFAGCWLKGRFGTTRRAHSGSAGAVTHAGAARTSTAGELAAPRPHYEPVSTPQPAAALVTETAAGTTSSPKETARPGKAAKPVAAAKTASAKTRSSPAKAKAAKAAAPKAAATKAKPGKEEPAAKPKAAAPKAAAKAKPAKEKPVAPAAPDNLKQIKGIGPQLETKLNAIGITSFAQISKWTKKDQANFSEQLSFPGRIERDDWVAQAKVLAKGGATEFSKRVAKGEVASSAGPAPKRGSKKTG
jgi:predicted flap endonuclease-1-like 5' DNA nuclease